MFLLDLIVYQNLYFWNEMLLTALSFKSYTEILSSYASLGSLYSFHTNGINPPIIKGQFRKYSLLLVLYNQIQPVTY